MRILLFTAILALSFLSCTGSGGGSSSTSRTLRFQHYLKAAHPGSNDYFGSSIAISGDTMVVGAIQESSSATGVNGDQTDDGAPLSGAAYVFRRSGGGWVQEAYLKASNTDGTGYFGGSVAISGNVIAVGAHYESSAATGINGDQTNTDAMASGAVYIFRRTAGVWTQEAYIKASNTAEWDRFGSVLALTNDTLAVSAPFESKSSTGVNGDQHDTSNPFAGSSGAVYVFRHAEGSWSQEAYIKASDPDLMAYFGSSIALVGDTMAVGSNGAGGNSINDPYVFRSGSAYIFGRTDGVWSQRAYLKASNPGINDHFGTRVAMAGNTLVISAMGEASSASGINGSQDLDDAPSAGAVYIFRGADDTWTQEAYIKASNPDIQDSFGSSLSLSGDTLLVGAGGESSNATGIDGDQNNDDLQKAGAVYLFRRVSGGWAQSAYIKSPNPGAHHGFGTAAVCTDKILVIGAYGESNSAIDVPGEPSSGAVYTFGYGSGSVQSTGSTATTVIPLGNG